MRFTIASVVLALAGSAFSAPIGERNEAERDRF